jgi:hypothetical protein
VSALRKGISTLSVTKAVLALAKSLKLERTITLANTFFTATLSVLIKSANFSEIIGR